MPLNKTPLLLSLTILNILLFTYIFRSVKQEEHASFRDFGNSIEESKHGSQSNKQESLRDGYQERESVFDTKSTQHPKEDSQNVFQHSAGPTPIILHTYMRSGSSFVGDLLKAGAGTYYTFEPVHMLQFTIRRMAPIRYLDKPPKLFNNFLDVAVPTVKDMVTCQFSKLPVPYFEDGFFPSSTRANIFTQCNKGGRMITDMARAKSCADELSKECFKSTSFVAKIIRLPLYSLETLMEQIPNLKIIHLVRDPRPTMLSQMKAGNVKNKYLMTNVTSYCNRVYDDVVKAEDFNRKFPGRLLRVHYEDIVVRPFDLTRQMYDFAGMPFTDTARNGISRLTGQTENHKSSNDKASAWRSSVSMDFIHTVDTACNQLYRKVGFQAMATESDIRDTTKVLRGMPPPFDDFRFA